MIDYSVGFKGINKYHDIIAVQGLLNKNRLRYPSFKQAQGELAEDGACGPLTETAIGQFQKIVLKYFNPDNRVDPGKATIRKLQDNVDSRPAISSLPMSQSQMVQQVAAWLTSITGPVNTTGNSKGLPMMKQNNSSWGHKRLGNSSKKEHTFGGYGCALLCLTMAATYLGSRTKHWPAGITPKQLNPIIANEIIKKANGFDGMALYIASRAATALGMKGTDSGLRQRLGKDVIAQIDRTLQLNLVMAHVHYKGHGKDESRDWEGDHWVLLTQKNGDGSYTAIDPAYGEKISLYQSPDIGEEKGHQVLFGRSTNKHKKVAKYRAVRFVYLTPKGVQ